MSLLRSGALALVVGVANQSSIAWAIAQRLRSEGATVVLSYQNERFGKKVLPLAEKLGAEALQCDFTNPDQVDRLFDEIQMMDEPLRYAVHSIAFSDTEQLKGDFLEVTEENFRMTMNVSCFSFITMARNCARLMMENDKSLIGEKGSIIGLTYAASQRPHPHYNVMSVAKAALESAMRTAAFQVGPLGIRVNMLSPSPEDTLSARGIGDFRLIGKWAEGMSMLGRRVTPSEIGTAAAFLLSEYASGITAQTIMVDGGASVSGMPPLPHVRIIADSMSAIASEAEKERPGHFPVNHETPSPEGPMLDHTGQAEVDEEPS